MNEIKLVCFDLDDTLIVQNSWYALSAALGVPKETDKKWLDAYIAGSITYDEWNAILLKEYMRHPNATRDGITKALTQVMYNEGARETVDYLKAQGYAVVLISGSIDIVVDHVAKDLGIELSKANNTFVFDDAKRLVSIHSQGDDTHAKAMHLEAFCDQLGIQMNECVCIGDGANDIEMFRRTGHGITFRGSSIESDAWKVIDTLHDIQTILLPPVKN